MRARILRAKNERQRSLNLIEGMRALGWQCLAQQDGRFYIAGAVCQPWNADVVFEPVAPDRFASYAVPDQVKIAWSIEAEPLGPALTRFVTETRAIGTGEAARRKFRRYWRFFGIGIVLIRKLLLARLRRIAEKTYRDTI
ncbi:MAG: hypothetical protein LAO79_25615 [Acidobacteriia bacterium]|nr:hypothetical protein [Terriglobia bacterium]